jgi:hypothetical protein
MQTAIATLRQLPETREQLESFANLLINEALAGNAEPLKIAKMLKVLEEIAVIVRKHPDVDEMIKAEISKHGKGRHVVDGMNIAIKQRTNYDLKSCGDPVYEDLKAKLKERETFLKALKTEVADTTDGYVISPPTLTVSEYYELTFAK